MAKSEKLFHKKLRGIHITYLMARDGEDCALCGEPLDRHIKNENHPLYVTFDHIIPSSSGGPDTLDNLQLAHLKCNQGRDCMTMEQWFDHLEECANGRQPASKTGRGSEIRSVEGSNPSSSSTEGCRNGNGSDLKSAAWA